MELLLHVPYKLIPTLELGAFIVASVLLFHRLDRKTLLARMPFFLEVVAPLLIGGAGDFGLAFPSVDGSLSRDLLTHFFELALALVLITGMPWAIVNLRMRRAIILNVLALVAFLGWTLVLLLGLTGAFVWYL